MSLTVKAPRRHAPVLLWSTLLLAACTHGGQQKSAGSRPVAVPQLSAGGRTIFPVHRVVAFYGAAGVPWLGVLGQAPPLQTMPKLSAQARQYERGGKTVIPAFELVATVAQRAPGSAGKYSAPADDATVDRYLRAAHQMRGLLILDIQPGRADFFSEVRRYEKFLVLPDVGLALDPEWKMASNEVPAQEIGHTTAGVINRISAYLADIVERHNLPQKLLVIHEFTDDMVEHKEKIVTRPGIAITFHVDGFGSRPGKLSKYSLLSKRGRNWFWGLKLFYRQDVDLLAPSEVLSLRPQPDLVTYQ